ncbi:hypothetical protein Hanom_Chr10g00908011 [Helianthus anomalus]
MLVLRIFLEKRAEFPLFLDAPDNTSCRYFSKFNNINIVTLSNMSKHKLYSSRSVRACFHVMS